jgi:hypothetical protein
MSESKAGTEGLMAKLTQLSALYVVYLFISGWTFFDYYYREFGIDPRWLDLPLQEILMKGFTILFTGGGWLWPIYLFMIVGTLIVDEIPAIHRRVPARPLVAAILFAAVIGVYFASRAAGSGEAMVDKGGASRLPLITFSRKAEAKADPAAAKTDAQASPAGKTDAPPAMTPKATASKTAYTGGVLAFRNGVYYLHNVSPLEKQNAHSIALSVFRIEDLSDIKVAEH